MSYISHQITVIIRLVQSELTQYKTMPTSPQLKILHCTSVIDSTSEPYKLAFGFALARYLAIDLSEVKVSALKLRFDNVAIKY